MVKKIINLMKAFILFYSLPPPISTAPRTIKYRPPCVPRRSHVLYYPSPVAFALFGWLLCAIIDWQPPKATTKFGFLIFYPPIRWPKRCDSVLPHRDRLASRIPQLYNIAYADLRLVVASPHQLEAIKTYGPVALSILTFSIALFDPPNDW